MSWDAINRLSMEQVLCLIEHIRLGAKLDQLEAESARIASMPFAQVEGQQRLLVSVEHQRRALLDRFYQDKGNDFQ